MGIDSNTPPERTGAESPDDVADEKKRAATTAALTEKVQNLQTIPATGDAAQIAAKREADNKPDAAPPAA